MSGTSAVTKGAPPLQAEIDADLPHHGYRGVPAANHDDDPHAWTVNYDERDHDDDPHAWAVNYNYHNHDDAL